MDTRSIVSAIAIVVSLVAIVIGALLRYAVSNRDREVDKRLDALEGDDDDVIADVKKLNEKQHADEVARVKLEGAVALLNQANTNVDRDLKDIKSAMVSRTEWTEAQARIEAAQMRLEQKLDTALSFARYRPTPLSMHAQRPLPREEGALDEFKVTPRGRDRDR